MSPVPVLLGGLVLLGVVVAAKRNSGNRVEVNGRTWILEPHGDGWIVYSPAKQFGPHGKMAVFAFTETPDTSPGAAEGQMLRQVTARYPQIPVGIHNAALADLMVRDLEG